MAHNFVAIFLMDAAYCGIDFTCNIRTAEYGLQATPYRLFRLTPCFIAVTQGNILFEPAG